MDSAPSEYAAEHASAVAREVVRLGLADADAVRRCFQEYAGLLRAHGPRGTFTQLLLVRGLVDRAGFDRLQAAVPPDPGRLQGSGSATSQVFRLTPGALAQLQAPVATIGRPPTPPPGASPGVAGSERTSEFNAVIDSVDPDAEGAGGRTMEFAAVLPTQAAPGAEGDGLGSSDELELPVLPPPAPAPTPSRPGSSGVRPAPNLSASTRPTRGSAPSSPSGRSAKTPDPVKPPPPDDGFARPMDESTVAMREDEVFPVPGGRVKTTTDSRTPGGALDLVPEAAADAGPKGYDLGLASQDDASGKDFYLSDENDRPDSQEQVAAASEPQPGQVLGGHELIRVLGRGGMGVIYIARKQGQAEQVALKVLLGTNDPGADRRRQRFRAEFEALRRLEHPNIVRVHDFGREGAFDWYTMQYVEGKDFERLLAEGSLEPQEKLDVFGEVCQALGHAHERNVIHRDVKPQNVLVDAKGHAHVLDFGLAKILDQGVGMTRTGSSLGTPFYMAPEQLRSAKHVDARADVFALGVMLYEIVTGVRPFPGDTAAEVGSRILNEDPQRPSKVKKGVHPDLDAICLKALEKEAERRYADANEVYEDLVRYRKGLGAAAARTSGGAAADMRRWAARNRAGLIGGLVASGLLVPALIVVLAMKGGGSGTGASTGTSATPPPATEPAGTEEAPAPSDTARTPPAPPSDTAKKPPAPTTAKPPAPPTGTLTPPPPSTTSAPPPSTTSAPPPATTSAPPPTTTAPPPPRTPVEVARAALTIPDERASPSGAEQAVQAHGTTALQRALLLGLEGVVAPMAVGETARALEALRALRATPGLQLSALAEELEHDAETLAALRALAGARVAELPRGRSIEVHGGERLNRPPGAALEGGWLRVGDAGVVDPLAFDLATLRALVLDPKVDHPPTRYALAVLGVYRGLEQKHLDADLGAAGATPAGERRRKLADWLLVARREVWRGLEEEAEATWRDVQAFGKKDSEVVRAAQAWLAEHGRTAAFRARRDEWLQTITGKQPWPELLHGAQRQGRPQVVWKPLRGEGLTDFEVAPLDDKRPFRAEAQSAAVWLENGRLALELEDLVGSTAEVKVDTDDVAAIGFGPLLVENDPKNGWTVKLDGRQVAHDPKSRKLDGTDVTFERDDEKRTFKVGAATLSMPLADAARGRWQNAALSVQAEARLRVSEAQLTWRDDENAQQRAQKLARRLAERDLLARLLETAPRHGHVLARLDVARPTALVLEGAWEAQGGALAGSAEASARLAAWADLGVLRFELAHDDGRGVRLTLRPAGASGGGTAWLLPGRIQPDPAAFRQVTVLFDLKAKAVAVFVDGLRLRNPGPIPVTQQGVFGLELVDRTRARLRSLELVQLAPRAGLRP